MQTAVTEISNLGSVINYVRANGLTGSFNTTFVGTREQYDSEYAAGNIPVGTIVIITDEEDDTDDDATENAGVSSSILGTGVLGYMILG